MNENLIIDHTKEKIHEAMGLSSAMTDKVATIVADYFTSADDGPGHHKISICLQTAIEDLKRDIFKAEGPIVEYEASLAYLAYLVGSQIAENKNRFQRVRSSNPLIELLEQEMFRRSDKKIEAGKPIMFKCDSDEEAQLFQAVMQGMAAGQFSKAMGALLRLKDIKEGTGKKG